ncbi:hypothetical protein B0H11DRAFT_2118654 [Mycena galericulata]|nr:hypothetical protein B0H11DRAFT_2118654 [Mycena galericulata]
MSISMHTDYSTSTLDTIEFWDGDEDNASSTSSPHLPPARAEPSQSTPPSFPPPFDHSHSHSTPSLSSHPSPAEELSLSESLYTSSSDATSDTHSLDLPDEEEIHFMPARGNAKADDDDNTAFEFYRALTPTPTSAQLRSYAPATADADADTDVKRFNSPFQVIPLFVVPAPGPWEPAAAYAEQQEQDEQLYEQLDEEEEDEWTGEWNREDMQSVIRKLRNLKS